MRNAMWYACAVLATRALKIWLVNSPAWSVARCTHETGVNEKRETRWAWRNLREKIESLRDRTTAGSNEVGLGHLQFVLYMCGGL